MCGAKKCYERLRFILLKIETNELIHSYLYRFCFVNGKNDFSNILTNKGGWKSRPSLLSSLQPSNTSLSEKTVLEKLLKIRAASLPAEKFSYDVSFRDEVKYFFQVDFHFYSVKSQQSNTIRFCDQCLKEHIFQCGYGVIDESWFHGFFCDKHDKPLYRLTSKSRANAVQELGVVLSGQVPESAKQYSGDWKSLNLNEYFSLSGELIYAPCFLKAFSDFIIFVSKTKHAKDFLGKRYSSEREMRQRYLLNHVYTHLKKNKTKLFQKYWPKYAQEKDMDCGVLEKSSLTVRMVKFSLEDCYTCKNIQCVANGSFNKKASIPSRAII